VKSEVEEFRSQESEFRRKKIIQKNILASDFWLLYSEYSEFTVHYSLCLSLNPALSEIIRKKI